MYKNKESEMPDISRASRKDRKREQRTVTVGNSLRDKHVGETISQPIMPFCVKNNQLKSDHMVAFSFEQSLCQNMQLWSQSKLWILAFLKIITNDLPASHRQRQQPHPCANTVLLTRL